MMNKKSFVIISFAFIFLLSMSIVFSSQENVQDEKISFGKWLNNLWGKITGNPIFQRGNQQSPSLASIDNNQNRNLFSRAQSSQIQTSPTAFPNKEISLEITKENEEIKELTSNLLELNNQYKKISSVKSSKKKSILSELEKSAIEREKEMIELAKQNPILFLNNIISEEKRNLFPDKIKKYIEQETIVEGNLLTLHIDDFSDINNPISKFEYFIITEDNKKINFYPIISLGFMPQVEIKASGYQIDNNIVGFVKEIETKKEETPISPRKITGKAIRYSPPVIPPMPEEHKMAVILVNFLDSPPSPFTPTEAHELIFNGQFQNFYREQSYNKIYFTGNVFGWYTLPRNTIGGDGCSPSAFWGNQELNEIVNNNINLGNYEHLLIISNGLGCIVGESTYGTVDIGEDIGLENHDISMAWVSFEGINFLSPSYWSYNYPPDFSWTNLDYVLTHEIGHGLTPTLPHANGYDCGEQTYTNNLYTNCEHVGYGNPFDAMGAGTGYAFHFNGFHKELLGWVSSQDSLSITKSGTYTINTLETPNGKKFAKIKMLGNAVPVSNITEKSLKSSRPYYPYYLEYRKGIGFDNTLNDSDLISNQDGLLINMLYFNSWVPPPGGFVSLLDMNATSFDWYEDLKSASLSGENIFYDPLTGITIGPIISSTPTEIIFNVDLQQTSCIREQPLIKDTEFLSDNVPAGNNLFLVSTIINPDYPVCGLSEFNITANDLPSGFYSYDFPRKLELFPLNEVGFIVGIQTSPTLCSGTYPIIFSVENLNSGVITTETIYINIAGTTPCLPEVAPPEF